MWRRKLDPAVAASVTERIRSVESSSSAEVVVEVRARSGSYSHADARLAAMVAFIALLIVLFSPWTFEPIWVPPVVLAAYITGVMLSRVSATIGRAMTTRRDRDARVRTTAAAAFVERGVRNTSRETGLFIFLSLLERRMELIADRGVLDAVPVLAWNQVLEKTRHRKADTEVLLDVLREIEPLLTRYLPGQADDKDELSNEVHFVSG